MNEDIGAGLPPAVLCDMSLDIARGLASYGVPVYAVDWRKDNFGRNSKALRFVLCPYSEETDAEDYIDFLVEFGRKLGTTSVLYPLADRQVTLFSQYREALQKHYAYVMPPHETLMRLIAKDGLASVARQFSIPAPQTFVLDEGTDIGDIARKVSYPALLKPTQSPYWQYGEIYSLLTQGILASQTKVILCHDSEELSRVYEQIAVHDPRMVVQEVIPGEDSRLVYASFYVDRNHNVIGYFAGRKLRIVPTGVASFAETFSDPNLQELVFKIVSDVGYEGLGGLEFKQDPRDGEYKLIEFNTRFGGWSGLGMRCGVDLGLMAYRDALGLPVDSQLECQPGVRWLNWERDIRAFVDYRRRGELTFREWCRSLRGPKMIAIYSLDDWKPGVVHTVERARKLGTRTLDAIARGRRGRDAGL